jgi:hypothetical protein
LKLVEGKGFSLAWDENLKDGCQGCESFKGCNKVVCAAFPDTSTAKTFKNICQMMKELSEKDKLVS